MGYIHSDTDRLLKDKSEERKIENEVYSTIPYMYLKNTCTKEFYAFY